MEGLLDSSEACYGVRFGDGGNDKKTGDQAEDATMKKKMMMTNLIFLFWIIKVAVSVVEYIGAGLPLLIPSNEMAGKVCINILKKIKINESS